MSSKNLLKDLFNSSKSTLPGKKTPRTQRRSRLFGPFDDDQKAEDGRHFMEKMERSELVESAFEQYQRKYPNQWNKLKWEASYKETNETYDGPSEDDHESVHIEWHENMIRKTSGNKNKGLNRPISPLRKDSPDKMTKRIAVAKKVLCFGSFTPEE